MMRTLARRGSGDMLVREQAHKIIRQAGVRGHDFLGELRALFAWVRDHVRYVKDPYGIETLQNPRYTIQHRMGDCDDKAILLSALLLACGHPARVMFRAMSRRGSRNFSHVYVLANLEGKRIALDPTRAGTPFGWEYANAGLRGDFAI